MIEAAGTFTNPLENSGPHKDSFEEHAHSQLYKSWFANEGLNLRKEWVLFVCVVDDEELWVRSSNGEVD